MAKKNNEIIETEIIVDEPQQSTQGVDTLLSKYNSTKGEASQAVETLTNSFTLKGMDSINELVSEAMREIQEFTDNGKEVSTISKGASRALALIDPNNKWAGKWFDNAKDNIEEEKLKEKTINEVINTLIEQIELKRDEVIDFIQAANDVKKHMLTSLDSYRELLSEAKQAESDAEPDSKEFFDAGYLKSMLLVSIAGIESDIKSQVDPLIGGARISVNQITTMLPTIENDLKYKSGFKAFQQALSDLNGIVKTTTELAANAGDVIRKDVNNTIYQSLEMLGETGLDAERFKKIQIEEQAHHRKINEVMYKTQEKMKKNFETIEDTSRQLANNRVDTTNALLESYSEVK